MLILAPAGELVINIKISLNQGESKEMIINKFETENINIKNKKPLFVFINNIKWSTTFFFIGIYIISNSIFASIILSIMWPMISIFYSSLLFQSNMIKSIEIDYAKKVVCIEFYLLELFLKSKKISFSNLFLTERYKRYDSFNATNSIEVWDKKELIASLFYDTREYYGFSNQTIDEIKFSMDQIIIDNKDKGEIILNNEKLNKIYSNVCRKSIYISLLFVITSLLCFIYLSKLLL
ncbi:MAG: hypothetical protein WD048_03335 [Chitinophagales bacterium]